MSDPNILTFRTAGLSPQHHWRLRAPKERIIAASTEAYDEPRAAYENVAQVLGAGILAGHHVIPDDDDRAAVMAAIEARYGVPQVAVDTGLAAKHLAAAESSEHVLTSARLRTTASDQEWLRFHTNTYAWHRAQVKKYAAEEAADETRHTHELRILASHGIVGDDARTAYRTYCTRAGQFGLDTINTWSPTDIITYFGADAARVASVLAAEWASRLDRARQEGVAADGGVL